MEFEVQHYDDNLNVWFTWDTYKTHNDAETMALLLLQRQPGMRVRIILIITEC